MVLRFLLELHIAEVALFTQFTTFNSSQHSAIGFLSVATIGIAAIHRKLADVIETLLQPIAGAKETKFSHSGRINYHRTLAKDYKLPSGCCVYAFTCFADTLCLKSVMANQAIDESRLADTR